MSSDLLSTYYGGIEQIETYYNGRMYQLIKDEVGEDIFDVWAEYWDLKDSGGNWRAFWDEHPELQRYRDLRDTYTPLAADAIVSLADRIAEGAPAELREDLGESQGVSQIEQGLSSQQQQVLQLTFEDWRNALGTSAMNLVVDYIVDGDSLPNSVRDRLDIVADTYGLDQSTLLEVIRRTLSQQAAP